MENLEDRLDIELPYGFTTMHRYNSSESNYPNYSDFAYNDKILMGAVMFKPTVISINTLIYADVILRPHNYFYYAIGGRGGRYSLNHSQLDKCVITTISGYSVNDIIEKCVSIRNNFVLKTGFFNDYINKHVLPIIESVINQADSVQLDSIMTAITESSEINGEYVAMCLKRKSELGYIDPEKELIL